MPWKIKALPEQRRCPREQRARKAGAKGGRERRVRKAWLSIELLPGLPPPELQAMPLPGSHGPETGDHAAMVVSGLIDTPSQG